jgi:N-acetylated-alpha-linked acidic dipeptidase
VDTGWRKTPILVAELDAPGTPANAPFVLFSGHHDTWYFGVMDNGAANATMMEVARLAAAEHAQWRRGLRLCFWSGHSHGRYSGSTWYVDHHWHELAQRCVAHVNCDSTGGRGNTVLADTPASTELKALGAEAVRAQGGQEMQGLRMSRAGDSSFWGVGIPSLFMGMGEQPAGATENVAGGFLGSPGEIRKGAGFGWWWHTPDDTLDKIDPELLARDTRIYVHAVWRLLTDAVLPFDYGAVADDLDRQLTAIAGAAGDGLDLAALREAVARLRQAAAALRQAAADPARTAEVNTALMRMGRALVPIDCTSGDRFGHDPALPQAPFPSLDPLRALAALPADSDEAKFAAVAAVRAVNRVRFAIEEAVAAALAPTR